MRKRITITLVVLLVVAAALLFQFRQRKAASRAGVIPELLLLSPADADSIVYVDLEQLRHSHFLTQLLAFAPSPDEDPDYREFVVATGFDYSRDLDRAMIATRATSPQATTMAIADGQFDRAKIAAYSLRSGKLEKRNGAEVYVVPSGRPAKTISFAFLTPERVLLANSSSLDLSTLRPAQNVTPGQEERFLRVAGAAVILLTRVDASEEKFSVFGFRSRDLRRALRDVRWLSLGARPDGDTLKVAIEAECISADTARELTTAAEALRFLARVILADARMRKRMSPQATALLEVILRNGEFIQTDQRVQFRFELSAEALATSDTPEAGGTLPGKPR